MPRFKIFLIQGRVDVTICSIDLHKGALQGLMNEDKGYLHHSDATSDTANQQSREKSQPTAEGQELDTVGVLAVPRKVDITPLLNSPSPSLGIYFKDKVILVTGAYGEGLSANAAIKYAALGANPLILGTRTTEKEELAKSAIIQRAR
ncbi:unnamed protein product [Clonostachys rhizophaga]|uniref:Uncharacterized protein n=1 Tax=Clonostachys rhizophaga TaxID=160324 RepID=A0A9N9VES8_9HYPO|nr:unnamed protein product [Clonostachys rhizophaga]